MDSDSHRYNSNVHAPEDVHDRGAAHVVSNCRTGTCAASFFGNSSCVCSACMPGRVPCCCEALRETTIPARHPLMQSRVQKDDGDRSFPTRSSSSRRCVCCVPERDELQECERREREQRYQSMRAERKQLHTALYDNLWDTENMQSYISAKRRYKPNTAHLLRCSQGTIYRRAAALEQEKRRHELRREIEVRKRELGQRGSMRQPFAYAAPSPVAARGVLRGQRSPDPTSAGISVGVCGTEDLRQHQQFHTVQPAVVSRSKSRLGATRQRHASQRRKASVAVSPTNNGGDRDGDVRNIRDPQGKKHTHSKGGGGDQTKCVPQLRCYGRGGCCFAPCKCHWAYGCCRCCCVTCRCCLPCKFCSPCASCPRNSTVHAADDVPMLEYAEVPEAPSKTVPKVEKPVPQEAAVELPRPASPSPNSHRSVVSHGRKVYITDDAYLSRRSQVIERLERDGYVRLLTPTTRSPSAPLPEKTRKWETTRSTSAHRV